MTERDRRRLLLAGVDCPPDVTVEINPLWAFDSDEIRRRLPAGFRVSTPMYFSVDHLV
jgi:hypothetical protein